MIYASVVAAILFVGGLSVNKCTYNADVETPALVEVVR